MHNCTALLLHLMNTPWLEARKHDESCEINRTQKTQKNQSQAGCRRLRDGPAQKHRTAARRYWTLENNGTVFSQGDAAEAIYFIQAGKVKITVVSAAGKEASPGDARASRIFR